ncbi:DUF4148 domain-containing protein [Paraburkholderia sp. C35]|uniref:DUF4148 domain-containing protein n=1 Tax=Paraburkholderia sp. C35 TaxID=2126993 RepID=UPI000D68FA62|nr:DUF4148 domain-containing protein [Paraburkholderia sp. C35]
MKAILATVVSAAALATPLYGFAQQDSAPVTRAEVRADLAQVERAGYEPSRGEDPGYPADIQAAERKVAMQPAGGSGQSVGGVSSASSSGRQMTGAAPRPCVGPVSYCNLFFGS